AFKFYPAVALCCRAAGILYLALIYDGEDFGLYHTAVHYETNRIFTFDSSMAARLKERGAKYVWYLPLGANLKRLDALSLSEEEQEKYRADLSFIGNLYQNKISLDQYQYPPYVKGFLEGAIQ
ncbi:MAG: DUF3880 domain-containing protein, partial [Lachnospiraceae bacterium]|nr:DUF3880 domain-containing protein [Lachnospiraceae bacterium]